MKITEVRIGNLLFVPGVDREVIVSGIFRSHFVCEDKDGIRFEESVRINYQPILITEEYLLKFGFENWDINSWAISKRISIYKQHGVYWFRYNSYSGVCLRYVHQLQNLYFALTGEELKEGNNT